MACKKECFTAILPACNNDYMLKAGLDANTDYYWVLTDRHGNLYQRKVLTDADGILTMEQAALPAGINPHSGHMNLTIHKGDDYLQLVELTFDDTYTCVDLSFTEYNREESDNSEINYIQYKEPA